MTSVLLGGQQKTSKFAAALDIEKEQVQQDALRAAVGAKINAPYLSTSLQVSKEKGTSEIRGDQKYVNLAYLGMSASGGNTLIGSNIPTWTQTVAPFKNWRVIENEIAVPLHDLIGKLDGWRHVPELFDCVRSVRSATHTAWNGAFSLHLNGFPLGFDKERRSLSTRPQTSVTWSKAKFFATGADFNHGRKPKALHPDWPLHLSMDANTRKSSVSGPIRFELDRDRRCARMIPSATDQQDIKCRFSFRKVGQTGPWRPWSMLDSEIESGDQVHLYSHSLGLGPFANLHQRPPLAASPAFAFASANARGLIFPIYADTFDPATQQQIQSYDLGEHPNHFVLPVLSPGDREAYEKMGIISMHSFTPYHDGTVNLFGETTVPAGARDPQSLRGPKLLLNRLGRPAEIDYKLLQAEPFRSASLDWSGCHEEIAAYSFESDSDEPWPEPAVLTIVFE